MATPTTIPAARFTTPTVRTVTSLPSPTTPPARRFTISTAPLRHLHDLIGSTEPTNAKTTYIYGDQLILPSGPAFSAYAIVTRTSDNFVWDSSLGWVSSSSNDHLSMTAMLIPPHNGLVRPDRSEHNSGHRRQHRLL